MKSKLNRATVIHDGEIQKRCNRLSSDLWARKLRCACGSSFRKNRYHKDKDGNVTYNYVCYNQVNYGKASQREKDGLDTDGYCDEAPITEWKLDLMAQYFFDEVWKSRADEVMLALDSMKKYYIEATQKNTLNSKSFVNAEIEKAEKRIKSLITMFADGSITKDEFDTMKAEYKAELSKLREQKTNTSEQQSLIEQCISNMTAASKTLYDMVNMKKSAVDHDLIDRLVIR